MSFPQVQRVFIVEHCLASRSYLTCLNVFRNTFFDSLVSNNSTVSRLVNRFRDTGSVKDRKGSDRNSVFSDVSLDDMRQTLLRSPRKSLWKLSPQSSLPYGNVNKVTVFSKIYPYLYMLLTNSRNLVRKKDFSTADGFHTSLNGYRLLDKCFYYVWVFRFSRRHTLQEMKKILSCAFQTSLQKLFTGLHYTCGKEWMHAHKSHSFCSIIWI
jgi:hypothetical protein